MNQLIESFIKQTTEKRPRESILRTEFANAIEVINKDLTEENQLKFLHWDLSKHSRRYIVSMLCSSAANVCGYNLI